MTAPKARGTWASEIAAPISFSEENKGGVWPMNALAYPGSQVGPFRRTSAPHDRERFTWQRILCQNAQRSVVQVRTPVLKYSIQEGVLQVLKGLKG